MFLKSIIKLDEIILPFLKCDLRLEKQFPYFINPTLSRIGSKREKEKSNLRLYLPSVSAFRSSSDPFQNQKEGCFSNIRLEKFFTDFLNPTLGWKSTNKEQNPTLFNHGPLDLKIQGTKKQAPTNSKGCLLIYLLGCAGT